MKLATVGVQWYSIRAATWWPWLMGFQGKHETSFVNTSGWNTVYVTDCFLCWRHSAALAPLWTQVAYVATHIYWAWLYMLELAKNGTHALESTMQYWVEKKKNLKTLASTNTPHFSSSISTHGTWTFIITTKNVCAKFWIDEALLYGIMRSMSSSEKCQLQCKLLWWGFTVWWHWICSMTKNCIFRNVDARAS